MVEWHLKLEDVETPDSAFSVTPTEMRALIRNILNGEGNWPPT